MIPVFSDVNLALYFRRSSENTKLVTDPFSVGQIFVILAKNTLTPMMVSQSRQFPRLVLCAPQAKRALTIFPHLDRAILTPCSVKLAVWGEADAPDGAVVTFM